VAQGTFQAGSGRPQSTGHRKDQVINRAEQSIASAATLKKTRELCAEAEERRKLRTMTPKRAKVGIGEMSCDTAEKLLKEKLVFAFDSCTKVPHRSGEPHRNPTVLFC